MRGGGRPPGRPPSARVVSGARGSGRTLYVDAARRSGRARGPGGVVAGGKSTMSGPKGFALVLAGMLGIMAVLWGLAALVAP
ncbi:hypothetical protein GCM10010182_52470 [Actinomadura cremea]|nr:hypothetical protein GCM10010182_52470 [Actinomadura cremea]